MTDLLPLDFIFSLTVGDWSRDGHEKTDRIIVRSTHSIEDIVAAADTHVKATTPNLSEATCNRPGSSPSWGGFSPGVCCDYEDSVVPLAVWNAWGLDIEVESALGYANCATLENPDDQYGGIEIDFFELVFRLAGKTLPDLRWEAVEMRNLNVGGYGLFF
jgi:hypothetical protein